MRGSAALWVVVLALAAGGVATWFMLGGSGGDASDDLFEGTERGTAAPVAGPMLSGTTRAKAEAKDLVEGRFEIPGRVLNAQGKPVAAVAVTARRRGEAYGTNDPRRWQARNAEGLARDFAELSSADEPPVAARTVSAEDGSFTLVVTRRGDYGVRAEPEPPLVGTASSWYLNATPPTLPVELRVLEGSALKGRVVDEQERGIAAVLRASWYADGQSWSPPPVATDPKTGAFAYAAVPAGKVRIEVAIAGKLRFTTRAIVTPTTTEVVIRVPLGSVLLSGSVKGVDGRPIAGAHVVASIQRAREAVSPPAGEGLNVRYFAQSDAEGEFSLGGPFVGALTVIEAAAAGYVPSTTSPPLATWSGLELADGRVGKVEIVLYQGGTLEGRVLEAGTGLPLAGAEVQVLPLAVDARMARPPNGLGVSDAAGRYVIPGVAVGRSLLLVRHPSHHLPALEALNSGAASGPVINYYSPDMQGAAPPPGLTVFVEREGQRITRDFELVPGVRVTGRVVDEKGQPAAGAEVRGRGTAMGQIAMQLGVNTGAGSPVLATSGPDGSFEIPGLAPRKDWILSASKPPLWGEPSAPLAVSAEAPPKDVVLKLVKGCVLAGRVVDAQGLPVPNVSLNAYVQTPDAQGESLQARSKEDGTFRMEGLPTGPLYLNGSGQVNGSSTHGFLQVEALTTGEVREGLELKLGGGVASLSGVLVDDKGQPLSHKPLVAMNPQSGSNSQAYTDGEGNFRFEGITAGMTQICAGDWSNRIELVTVTAPAQDLRVTWKEPPSAVLEGFILDAQGKPVPICQVSVKGAGRQNQPMMWGAGQGELAVNGWFRRQASGAGPYTVTVSRPQDGEGRSLNLKGKTVPVPDVKACPITITLEPGAEVAGRVLDPVGRGVAGVTVASGNVHTQTDPEGAFALGGLAEGPVSLQVSPKPPFVRPAPLQTTTGSRDLVVRLNAGVPIAGEVRGPDGKPLSNGWAQASWKGGTGGAGEASASVGQDGRFRIEGVPPEALVTLSIQIWGQDGEAKPPKTLENVRAGTEDLVIDIGVGAKITGSVLDSNGKPFTQGWVQVATVKDGHSNVMNHVQITADGSFTIAGLEPGRPVVLSVYPNNGNVMGEAVTVDAPATNVRLTMPAPTPIKGRIAGSLGSGKWRVWAWLASDPSKQVYATRVAETDGRFAIDGVAGAGPWMVAARSGEDDRYALDGPVAGGTDNVTLEPRQGRSIEGRLMTSDGAAPPENTQINASMAGWSVAARTDAQGNFRLRGLPPGRYNLQAWTNDGQMATQPDVEDGATGLRLTLGARR